MPERSDASNIAPVEPAVAAGRLVGLRRHVYGRIGRKQWREGNEPGVPHKMGRLACHVWGETYGRVRMGRLACHVWGKTYGRVSMSEDAS